MWNRNADVYVTIEPLEKFAQLVFMPIIRPDFKVVEEFSSDTERGEGGFGSTG
jgi:dUTP pyrophosphatase